MNNQRTVLILKVCGVFLCLYLFLIGISGLSKSISGLTTPENLSENDMVQVDEITIETEDGQKLVRKKVWVKILEVNDDNSYKYEFKDKENNLVYSSNITDDNIKKSASSTFLSAIDSKFICLFIGVFATVLFQSSSTTTSLIVGMAGGGLIELYSAIPMVMGANIGTTVTNTLISLGHLRKGEEFKRAFAASTVHDFFNILAVIIFFPIEYFFGFLEKSATSLGNMFFTEISEKPFQSPIKQAVSWGVDHLKHFVHTISESNWLLLIVSVVVTLIMLFSIVKLLRSMVLSKVEAFFDKYIFKTALRAMIFGFGLTVLVQSSSITTSVIVPLAGAGVLSLRQIFPFTLGANIGTTVTSLMAALVLNPLAMVVAFSHLLFNILGIVFIYPIEAIRNIPLKCAETISELAVKNKFIPVVYLAIVFVLIPLTIILLGG